MRSWSAWDSLSMVKCALRDLEQGNLQRAAQLADMMGRDDRVSGCLDVRTLGLLGLPLTFEGAGDARRKSAVSRTVEEAWWTWCPEAELAELLRWGLRIGVALGEIVWELGEKWTPRLKVWHPAALTWRWDLGCFQVQTMDGPINVTPGDGKWILFAPFGAQRSWMGGLVRRLAIPWLIRQWGWRDWARYSEVHGQPTRVARTPAGASSAARAAFLADVASLGTDPTIDLPQGPNKDTPGWDVTLLEAAADGWESFDGLLAKTETSIAIAVLGQNLSTEVKGGSYAATKVHDAVRGDLIRYDAENLATCLRQQLLMPWALYNLGDPVLAPWPRWDTEPPEDEQALAQRDKTTAEAVATFQAAGAPVDVRAYLEERGYPLLAEDPEPTPTPAPTPGTTQLRLSRAGARIVALASWGELWKERVERLKEATTELVGSVKAFFLSQADALLGALPGWSASLEGESEAMADLAAVAIWEAAGTTGEAELAAAIEAGIGVGLEAGGVALAAQLDLAISFDLQHPRAAAWMAERGLERAKLIQGTTREELRGLLVRAVGEGWGVDRTSREIRGRWKEFSSSRAELIAQAELGEAYEAGQRVAAQEAEARGVKLVKSWLTSGDGKVTAGCRGNAGAGWIGVEEAFPSGHQHPLRFPRCRCTCLYEPAAQHGRTA